MVTRTNWDWSKLPANIMEVMQTKKQERLLGMLIAGQKWGAIAKAEGVSERVIASRIKHLRKMISAAGYDPANGMQMVTPPPQKLTGRSALVKVDEKGDETVVMYWDKRGIANEERGAALLDYAKGLAETIPQAKPVKAEKRIYRNDLMPAIFVGDAHIGMRAWGKETKHLDFDTGIAVAQLREAVDYLVSRAEPSDVGLLVDVGDYTHADGHNNTTTAGTALDVDTRHRSTMYQAAMTMRYMISKMLDKCKTVHVVIARGNHNDNVAPAIELMLSFYYENEPRVKILPTLGYYHYVEYGNWLIGVTHGDKQKPEALAGSMARDMAEAWGRTTHRLWATGHYHKDAVKTLAGVKHKVFAALPPPDGWHASRGYAGDGEMEMWTFKRTGGVHSTHVFNIPQPRLEPDVKIA